MPVSHQLHTQGWLSLVDMCMLEVSLQPTRRRDPRYQCLGWLLYVAYVGVPIGLYVYYVWGMLQEVAYLGEGARARLACRLVQQKRLPLARWFFSHSLHCILGVSY